MKNYFLSLIPYRWILILILIICFSVLLLCTTLQWYYHVGNVFTWFLIDNTLGIGRKEENPYKNMIGLIYLLIVGYHFFNLIN